jgi:hypothetical protein
MPFPMDESLKDTIRHHFRRKKLVWDEDYFISVLQHSDSKYDVYWATIALRDCGTEKCLPWLREKLYYPMQDVKCTSILTIAHIAREKETLLYAQCLRDPKYHEKTYAIWAISDAADHRAIDAVLEYFRKNRSKIKRGKLYNGTVVDGIEYLYQYIGTSQEIEDFLEFVRQNWTGIAQGERAELIKRVPYFKED